MSIQPVTPAATLRRKTLAACLAAALAVGSAGAFATAQPALIGANAPSTTSWQPASLLTETATRPVRLFDPARIAPNSTGAIQAVANCNDTGTGSLRDAVTAAVDGDTIDLSALTCSTITLSSGAIEIKAKDLTIQGPGQDELRVSGNSASQVFRSKKYADNLAIKDLTIADGRTDTTGGCIYSGSSITLERVTVSGCVVSDTSATNAFGGGVFAGRDLVLVQSTVTGNTASGIEEGVGGGVMSLKYAVASDGSSIDHNVAIGGTGKARGGGMAGGFLEGGVIALYSRVSDNQVRSTSGSAYGGGMFGSGSVDNLDMVATVAFSTVSGNSAHSNVARSFGGGIQAGDVADSGETVSGSIQLISSTISGNSVTSDCNGCFIGGGGASARGQITADSSTIRDNTVVPSDSDSSAIGGGLLTNSYGLPTLQDAQIGLVNSTVSGNRAMRGGASGGGYGGGIASWGGTFVSLLSTITDNQASDYGGGVYADSVAAGSGLFSSVIANNHAPDGADIGSYGSTPLTLQGSHSLVRSVSSNITLPADTLNADPKLLPLANNGGLTATHALAACSPAIDAGMNTTPPKGFDQRGAPFVRDYGAAPDIGAFELQPDADRIFYNGFEVSPCP